MFHTGDKIPLIKYHGPNVPKFVQQERQQTRFHRSAALNVLFQPRRKLFSGNCASGASTLAGAAVDAGTCIHNSNTAVNSNCTNGASTLASATANTCVRNLVCHNKLSFYLRAKKFYEGVSLRTAVLASPEIVP